MLLRLPNLDGTAFAACGLESAWSETARRYGVARMAGEAAHRQRLELGLALEELRRHVPRGQWEAELRDRGIHARTARRALADARSWREGTWRAARKPGRRRVIDDGQETPAQAAVRPEQYDSLLSRPWGPAGPSYDFKTGRYGDPPTATSAVAPGGDHSRAWGPAGPSYDPPTGITGTATPTDTHTGPRGIAMAVAAARDSNSAAAVSLTRLSTPQLKRLIRAARELLRVARSVTRPD